MCENNGVCFKIFTIKGTKHIFVDFVCKEERGVGLARVINMQCDSIYIWCIHVLYDTVRGYCNAHNKASCAIV